MNSNRTTRRDFLGKSIVTGVGIAAGLRTMSFGGVAKAAYDSTTITATVGLTYGPDRADNAFRACQLFKNQIAAAIGNKRVVIKPNFVWYGAPLSCTNPSFTDGILEFLKSIGKRDVVIAESSAQGNIMAGYDAIGYLYLPRKYSVKLMDLNQEGFASVQIWKYGSSQYSGANSPNTLQTIRVSKMLLNPNNFIISAAPLKTHNTVLATMATKCIGMGAPVIDIGNSWAQPGNRGDKSSMHGPAGAPSGTGSNSTYDYQVLNDNVCRLVGVLGIRPNFALIDAYQGMEGNGPVSGTAIPTPQQVAVASQDFLAADRVGLELMGPTGGSNVKVQLNTMGGYSMPYPACLNYLWQLGVGEWDYRKIQVIGEQVANHNSHAYTANPYQTAGYETANIRMTPREGNIVNVIDS